MSLGIVRSLFISLSPFCMAFGSSGIRLPSTMVRNLTVPLCGISLRTLLIELSWITFASLPRGFLLFGRTRSSVWWWETIASPFPSLVVSFLHKRPLCFDFCLVSLSRIIWENAVSGTDTYSGLLLTCALFESGLISGFLVMNFASG